MGVFDILVSGTSDSRREVLLIGLYYLVIYIYIYVSSVYILKFSPELVRSPIFILIYIVIAIALYSLTAYMLYRRLGNGSFRRYLGFTSSSFLESLIFSSASITLPAIVLGIIAYVFYGVDLFERLFEATSNYDRYLAPPWFDYVPKTFLPLVALLVWLFAGVVWFALVQAFPIQYLSRSLGIAAIPVASVMFILLYNAPLLTGEWKLDDIIFLGVVYPTILYRYRNSLGLIVSYVALYEIPVRAAFLRGWGFDALNIVLLFQVAWG